MRLVCVAGMHRSGTSLVARVLNLLGADLGAESDLVPPADDNVRGFWENADVVDIDSRVLEQLGGTWGVPPPLDDSWETADPLATLRREAGELLATLESRGNPVVALKDPRLSLLAPLWASVRPIDLLVIPLRHPMQVAASLRERNGFDAEKSCALWIRYNVEALRAPGPTEVVDIASLMTDVEPAARALARAAGLDEPTPATIEAIIDHCDPAILTTEHDAPDGPIAQSAVALFETWSTGTIAPDVLGMLRLSWTAEGRFGVSARAEAGRRREARWEEMFTERTAHLAASRQLADERGRRIAQLERDSAAARRLETEIEELRSQQLADRRLLGEVETSLRWHRVALGRERARSSVAQMRAHRDRLATRAEAVRARHLADRLREHGSRVEQAYRGLQALPATRLALRLRRLVGHPRPDPAPLAPESDLIHGDDLVASGLFDADWYRLANPDVDAAGVDPLEHFLRHGAAEGRWPNRLFQTDWYLATHTDVAESGTNPLAHYLYHGAYEGRNPGPGFDSQWYLDTYPDVAADGANPLGHYLSTGELEGLAPVPPSARADPAVAEPATVEIVGPGGGEHARAGEPLEVWALLGLAHQVSGGQVTLHMRPHGGAPPLERTTTVTPTAPLAPPGEITCRVDALTLPPGRATLTVRVTDDDQQVSASVGRVFTVHPGGDRREGDGADPSGVFSYVSGRSDTGPRSRS